jgi:hypothetical protein
MRTGQGPWVRLAAALALSLVLGCGGREDGSSPEAAVRSLIATARAGDRAAVYNCLGPRTRAHIEALLGATHRTGNARMLAPSDLVAVGWLPPAWEPAGTRLVRRQGDEADVEVYSATGERQPVHTVREGRSWKVELPIR